jgi:predicted transcriptional regulator
MGVLVVLLAIIVISQYFDSPISIPGLDLAEQRDSSLAAESTTINSDPTLWNDLAARQNTNGSWDDDLETTVIASNALTQSNDIIENSEDYIDWDEENVNISSVQVSNEESIEKATNWTVDNYQKDEPVQTQVLVNLHLNLYRISYDNGTPDTTNITEVTNQIILDSQRPDGSWNFDVQDTGISLYVLKKGKSEETERIKLGEDWLIDQKEDNTWGSVKNDTFALLGLHDTDEDLEPVLEQVLNAQEPDGSFEDGDVETTAWAVIALSLYDTPSTREAASQARAWLINNQGDTDRELALISLAEVEYLNSEVTRIASHEDTDHPEKDKGPPQEFYILTSLLGGIIIILIILFLRLSEHDALDGVRKNIYEYIKSHPGVNQNTIKRRLELSSSSTRHHLKILEKYEHILTHNDGRYLRYYTNRNGYSILTNGNGSGSNYKEIISILRKKTAANIVKHLKENPNTDQRQLAEALNVHPSTIHWHMKLLLSSNIISANRAGKSVQYQLIEPMNIEKLLALAS